MTSTRLRPLAALSMVALIGAGCSSTPEQPGGGDTRTTQAVRFAQCMRDNGVTEFPDPDASGELTIDGVANRSSLDTSTPAWEQAIGACRDLQPPGFTGARRSAEEQEQALEFARCMRANGVDDFPDPTQDGPLINVQGARSIPGFEAAREQCRDVLAAALGDQ